jgi:hypothetical protein
MFRRGRVEAKKEAAPQWKRGSTEIMLSLFLFGWFCLGQLTFG